jgi:hypothetical protein
MAKPKPGRASRTLSLKLDGQQITAERFVRSVASFVGLIHEVSDAVAAGRGTVKWTVSVRSGSVIVHFQAIANQVDPNIVAESVRAVRDGLDLIEKKPQRPRYWSDAALKRAKELAETLDTKGGSLQQVTISADSTQKVVTRRMSANVDSLIGVELRALGSIEGRLRAVSEGGGLHFVVQDAVTHNQVRCYIKEEDTEKILAAFRKRVVVYGEISYRRDRQPASIVVERFRVLREEKDLPSAADVRGILA